MAQAASDSFDGLKEDQKQTLQAFADGINDYVQSVGQPGAAGRMLPPEFIAFGINEQNWRPWTPADSLGILRAMSFKLSWGWTYDLHRSVLMDTHPELASLVDDLVPFASNLLPGSEHTIIDESDLKQWGLYQEETLLERYEANK